MKKFSRKLLGLCLAASLAVTAVPPTQGMAAQSGEITYAEQTEQPTQPEDGAPGEADSEEGKIPGAEPETGDTQPTESVEEPGEKPETGDTQPTESVEEPGEKPETADTQTPEETEGSVEKPETENTQPAESTEPSGVESEPGSAQRPEEKQEDDDLQADGGAQAGETTPETAGTTEDAQDAGEIEGEEITRRQGVEEDIMPLAETYDINQPVIESFEFVENGQELTADDTLHFNISAYDADSGIKSVQVSVYSSQMGTRTISCTKTGDGNLYSGTYSCRSLTGTSFYISRVRVTDQVGNYVDMNVRDEKNQYLYKFTADRGTTSQPAGERNISLSNIYMQENDVNGDGKLSAGDTVNYTIDVTCSNNESVGSAYMNFYTYAPGYSASQNVTLTYDADTQKLAGTYKITEKTYPSLWTLDYISVRTTSGKSYTFYPYQVSPNVTVNFTVVQDDFDAEMPVIESITIDKNGQFVTAGDVVTITVKVSEEHPSQTATAGFSTMISNVLVSQPGITLRLNAETKEYTGTINITDDTYPCEWDLTSLTVYDEIGHRTYLTDFQQNLSQTYPWYYRVKAGNTYAEDVKDIPFKLYGMAEQEDGTVVPDTLIFDGTVEKVGRRASLKELGILPQAMEGNAPAGWKYNNIVVDEDTPILFLDATARTFTACYDKGCANVSLTYMTLAGETKTVNIPTFVDREASYRDVLDALKLPEDARTGDFDGFELAHVSEDHNEETIVGDVSSLSVNTNYSGTQVACTLHYFDRYGSPVSVLDSRTYPAGTKIDEVLSGLKTPEAVNGAAFEKWILPDYEGSGEDVINSSLQLDATAVYRGKTTADTSYTYRGVDGTMVSGEKMILVDGEEPTDATVQGQATDAFKDADHYEGLRLLEWTGDITAKRERYRVVTFTAQYYNCFIALVYPDGTYEYHVVDKGAEFALPSENEKYKDIIWEGYSEGAVVKVTGDMSFTVADAKQKGDEAPPETTGGVRLPADEIEEIVKKAQEAADGETITVDMKKATVIPKEVLEAIKDRTVTVVLDMGTYCWTVNGMDVAATEQRDIDLEVKVDTDAVPTSLVQAIAGDNPTTQLSLTHDGDFGFQASLTLNLGSEHSGETGNLYYYDSTGKLVFVNSGEITEDGSTSLTFSHASDYVIVIEQKMPSLEMEDRDEESGETVIKPGDDRDDETDDTEDEDADHGTTDENADRGTTDENAGSGTTDAGTGTSPSVERKTDDRRMRSPKTGE